MFGFCFCDLSQLLNARKLSWSVNFIFGNGEFGECTFLLDLVLWHSFHLFIFVVCLFNSLLIRSRWGTCRSTRKSGRLFEFLRIVAYKISIDLVLHCCKNFLFLWPKSWIFLVFLPKTPRIFLDFFPQFCKILRTLPRIISKILARNFKNARIFMAISPRRQALGILL